MQRFAVVFSCFFFFSIATPAQEPIPAARLIALDGHTVTLPTDLPHGATVLVFGFSRGAQKETTAWGKRVLHHIAAPPAIGFYEVADLRPVPGVLRGMILRSMRKNSPPTLQPHFLTLTQGGADWKRFAGYTPDAPDAAYVVLIDHQGVVHWRTHAPDSEQASAALAAQVHALHPPSP